MPEINVKPKGLEATSMGKYYFPERIIFEEIRINKRVKERYNESKGRNEWIWGDQREK